MTIWRQKRTLPGLICWSVLVAGLLGAAPGSSAIPHRPARAVVGDHGPYVDPAPSIASVTVNTASSGPAVHPGFLGLSIEYWALEAYAGKNPRAINPVLVNLMRNLMPDRSGLTRIGGVTTDWTWWPVPGLKPPHRVNYILSHRRLEVASALRQAVGGRLMMGVQFEAASKREAGAESRAMRATIGSGSIGGFELGNEPDLYGSSFGVQQYLSQFTGIAAAMGNVPVAGPALGSVSWLDQLGHQLSENRHLAVVTAHKYPLEGCASSPGAPDYPSIHNLFAPASSHGIAEFLQPYIGVAHAHHVQIRNGEINTVTCGSGAGVSNTFASALWALDTMFELAAVRLDGVNIHTYPGSPGQLFTFQHAHSRWLGTVTPEYYGLLTFAQDAPSGSQLLSVSRFSGPSTLHAWATRAPGGTLRVVLINEDTAHPAVVNVHLRLSRPALIERLQAPRVQSTSGVRIGGRRISPSTSTGRLTGNRARVTVRPSAGVYHLRVPAASAATLIVR